MKTAMGEIVSIPLRYLILLSLVGILALSILGFCQSDNEKSSAFFGGVSGGIVAVIIGFLVSMYEYRQIDRYEALGVRDILSDRRNTSYYRNIVKDAKEIVQVMGTSCIRFIDDFADQENDDHVLINALHDHDNLTLTLLVPTEENMDEKSKLNFIAGAKKLNKLQSKFQGRVFIKRYNFAPRHSLVRVDNDLIVGPVFQEVESQNSPAIHLTTKSAYAKKYLDYVTWVLANECSEHDKNLH